MFSASFGIGVFLMLLLFAAHVLLGLWVTSSVDSIAHDLATDVATSGADTEELPGVQAAETDRAREALGGYGDLVVFDFAASTPEEVVLEVSAPSIDLLPPTVAALLGRDGLHRRITVVREAPDQ